MRFDSISSLPVLIQERVGMDEHVDLNIALVEKYKLKSEQEDALLAAENSIFFGQGKAENLPALLQQKLVLDAQAAQKLAVELWGNYFLLFQDFLTPNIIARSDPLAGGDESSEQVSPTGLQHPSPGLGVRNDISIDKLITQHGGNLAVYQERAKKLLSPGRQLREYMREFLADTPLEKASVGVIGEIAEALVARVLGGTRDTFLSTVQMAITKENLPVEQAEKLVNNFEGMIAADTITKEWAQYYRELAENVLKGVAFREPSTDVIPSTVMNLNDQSSQNADPSTALRSARDDKVATLQATSYKLQAGSLPSREEYDHIASVIVSEHATVLSDPALASRLRQILVTRLKNIRSIVETREKLVAPPAVGGIGLSGDDADMLARVSTDVAEKILRGEYVIPQNKPDEQKKEIANDKQGIGDRPQGVENSGKQNTAQPSPPLYPKPYTLNPSPPALAIEEIDGLPVIVNRQAIGDRPQGVENSGKQNTAQPSPPLYPKPYTLNPSPSPSPSTLQPAPIPTLPPGAHAVPVIVRPPTSEPPRRKVVEQKRPPAKLVDAVEELRIMTLKDFRRLADDPGEAIRSINQKVQTLEKQSITKKMAAIDAWKENAISAIYRDMANESMFVGGRMDTVIAQRTAGGKDALTEAEFDALLELNELLRV